jgi:hypothetical protein
MSLCPEVWTHRGLLHNRRREFGVGDPYLVVEVGCVTAGVGPPRHPRPRTAGRVGELGPDRFDALLELLSVALAAPLASDGTRRALSVDGQIAVVLHQRPVSTPSWSCSPNCSAAASSRSSWSSGGMTSGISREGTDRRRTRGCLACLPVPGHTSRCLDDGPAAVMGPDPDAHSHGADS